MFKKITLSVFLLFSFFCFAEETIETSEEKPLTAEENTSISEKEAAETEEENISSEELTEEETPPLPEYIPLDLPGAERDEVEVFRKQYLQPKWSKLLYSYLENALEYRLYVRKALQDAELPAVLEYLPVVESNYNPKAKSKSGALGMWQFMSNSVKPFLTLNDFVDERLDPWKSTDGALRKLKDNYNYFGDWLLAIGAYNCGVGAMNKALAKAPADQKNFWYLAEHNLISKQTQDYVPKLLAIADLATNSEYYGIDLPSHKEEFELLIDEKEGNFDYLTVNKAYSLSDLASELKMDYKILAHLNPSYILGMTHPAQKSQIRLPLGMEKAATEALSKMTPIDFPIKYTVVAGDSLWSISRKYNVTVQAICDMNDIKENAVLRIGKVLYIPKK